MKAVEYSLVHTRMNVRWAIDEKSTQKGQHKGHREGTIGPSLCYPFQVIFLNFA